MFDLLIGVTAVVLAGGTVLAYRSSRDVLHPLLFLGPLFFYGCVIDPWLLRDQLGRFFPYPGDLHLVVFLNLACVAALVWGALGHTSLQRRRPGRTIDKTRPTLREQERVNLRWIASVLAAIGIIAYAYGILNVGGFVAAFSRAKGGGRAASGYIGEAMNLGLVGAIMAALSQYRRGWTPSRLLTFVLGLTPNIVQGTFGGRRGPLFLALATTLLAWAIVRPKPPKLAHVAGSFLGILLGVALVASQRQHFYLGSPDAELKWDEFEALVTQSDANRGNSFIYGSAFVLATYHSGQYTWGREMAVNLFVRPIPRQLWPTKYEDVGAEWVTSEYPGLGALSERDWLTAVGWLPLQGSSASCVSDLFGDFGWGAIGVLFLVGRGFAILRYRSRARGGLWALLYAEGLILTIYLATQSFSAFYHRYLILAVPTIIAWKYFVERKRRVTGVPRARRVGEGAYSPAAMR
jgi:hypothetical protein